MMTQGREGSKNKKKSGDVIYGWPLNRLPWRNLSYDQTEFIFHKRDLLSDLSQWDFHIGQPKTK